MKNPYDMRKRIASVKKCAELAQYVVDTAKDDYVPMPRSERERFRDIQHVRSSQSDSAGKLAVPIREAISDAGYKVDGRGRTANQISKAGQPLTWGKAPSFSPGSPGHAIGQKRSRSTPPTQNPSTSSSSASPSSLINPPNLPVGDVRHMPNFRAQEPPAKRSNWRPSLDSGNQVYQRNRYEVGYDSYHRGHPTGFWQDWNGAWRWNYGY